MGKIQPAIPANRLKIHMWLQLLVTNTKSYIGSPTSPLHWPLNDHEMSNSKSHIFDDSTLVKEHSCRHGFLLNTDRKPYCMEIPPPPTAPLDLPLNDNVIPNTGPCIFDASYL